MGIADRLFRVRQEKATENLKAGMDWLETNKSRPGITILDSGLQYEVITMGEGPRPTVTQTVTCHYEGKLIDGTVFDSSVKRGQPASFPLKAVIKGWTEGLQLMPVGSKWRFFIPPQLAYGERQAGAHIAPNSTLIFEVELLGIKD
jgi:FKBP-type peptidyl-prolyl cis-trans isomerase FklB